jgi:DNA-binding response OmpR family regulator
MERPLDGRLVLLAEDEVLIALDIKQTLEDEEGAVVFLASTILEALSKVDDPNLCAAILDHSFGVGNSSAVCEALKKRDIPFVNYTGHDHLTGPCDAGVLVQKPAPIEQLIATVKSLVSPHVPKEVVSAAIDGSIAL